MRFTSTLKGSLIAIVVLINTTPNALAIVLGNMPVTVRIERSKSGESMFDVVNLKQLGDAKSTAQWIYNLCKNSEGKDPHYSNSVHLEFSGRFERDQIQLICDTFGMNKVYIESSATIETDGKRVEFEYEPDMENMLRLAGFPEEDIKKMRDAENEINKAAEAGTGQPATHPELKPESSDKPQPETEARSR